MLDWVTVVVAAVTQVSPKLSPQAGWRDWNAGLGNTAQSTCTADCRTPEPVCGAAGSAAAPPGDLDMADPALKWPLLGVGENISCSGADY